MATPAASVEKSAMKSKLTDCGDTRCRNAIA